MKKNLVLIVDDDDCFTELFLSFLVQGSFYVARVSNGAEALSFMREYRLPDVIVLDLEMPVMDGWGFRRQQLLDERLSSVPVIIHSSHADMNAIPDLPRVRKSNDWPALIRAIERAMDR